MPKLLKRSDWTTHGPVEPLTRLYAPNVDGIAIHWPGTTGPIGDPGQSRIADRLEGYRAYHTAQPPHGKGWDDIAYNVAVDQAGRIWPLRGVGVMSAANGNQHVNSKYVAVVLLVGPGERPTTACVEAVRYVRSEMVLDAFPRATAVRGHRDVRPEPTACPGDLVEGLVLSGAFATPAKPKPAPAPKPYVLERYLLQGATGPDVEALQKRLNALLKRDTRVDGDFGPDTRVSVEELQELHELERDGIVGPATCKPLGWTWKP